MQRLLLTALTTCFLLTGNATSEDAETYVLRYKLTKGEKVRYEVTHMAKTKTRIKGAEGVSQVHTISNRHWEITDQNKSDQFTFEHIVDTVQMTQQQDDEEEQRWDSESGEEPQKMFTAVADRIGKKLATLTINSKGQVVKREDHGGSKATLGMGSLTLALPEQPLKIGDRWSVPQEIKARTEDGLVKTIKIREVYTLDKVQTGVATLTIKSEPLTPMTEESVRAQVIQHLSNGTIKFDIDNGRLLSKQLDWDETVVGFNGPNSVMEYRSRMTEKLVDDVQRTAKKP